MTDLSSIRGAQGTSAAAAVLRSDPPVPALRLYVIDDLAQDDDAFDLEDMVSALESNHDIHTFGFEFTVELLLDPSDGFPRDGIQQRRYPKVRQLDLLFGEVLPLHRSLKVVSFEDCPISSRFIQILMEGLARHGGEGRVGMERLTFGDISRPPNLWDELVPSVVKMLRSNQVVSLQALDMTGCNLSARHCQQLFDGLAGNAN